METNSPYHPAHEYERYTTPTEIEKFDGKHIFDSGLSIPSSEAKHLRRNGSFVKAMEEGLLDREIPLPTHELSVPSIEQYLAINGIVNTRTERPHDWSETYESDQRAPIEQARDELKAYERKVAESLREGRTFDSGVPREHPFFHDVYSKRTAKKVEQETRRMAGELDASLIIDSVISSVSKLPLESQGSISVFREQIEAVELGRGIGAAPPNEIDSRGTIEVRQLGNLIAVSFNGEETLSWFRFAGKLGVFRKTSGDSQPIRTQILVDTDKQTVMIPSLRTPMKGRALRAKWEGVDNLLSVLEKAAAQEEELPSFLIRQ